MSKGSKLSGLLTVKYDTAQTVMKHNMRYETSNSMQNVGFSHRTEHCDSFEKFRDSDRKHHATQKNPTKLRYAQQTPAQASQSARGDEYGTGDF